MWKARDESGNTITIGSRDGVGGPDLVDDDGPFVA